MKTASVESAGIYSKITKGFSFILTSAAQRLAESASWWDEVYFAPEGDVQEKQEGNEEFSWENVPPIYFIPYFYL